MKNLANCKPSEFLVQSNKIRKSVSKWLTDTDILNIRKKMPEYSADMTDEERKKALEKQAVSNLNAVLSAVLEEHPDETLEVLALCCFIDPKHVDDYTVAEYLDSIRDLISNKSVLSFFTSLASLESLLT